jgi:hypothetical protein
MAGEYNKCVECGQEECSGGMYRPFFTYGKYLFCSFSCVIAFQRMYWMRMRQRSFSDGNFPSYRRR